MTHSQSAFFNSLAVIVVPILNAIFRGKRMGSKGFLSVATALAGVGLLQLGPAIAAGNTDLLAVTHGDVLCLLQAIFFGIGYWKLERASSQFPDQSGPITAGQLVALAIGATGFAGLHGDIPSLSVLTQWLTNPFILKALLWTGLISTAFALYLETVALSVVSAAELTVLMTSVSLWGSAFAYVTMHELLPPIGLAGGLLILGGCALTAQSDVTEEA
jgi:drug/metabolite transporter (DMT)-like permease